MAAKAALHLAMGRSPTHDESIMSIAIHREKEKPRIKSACQPEYQGPWRSGRTLQDQARRAILPKLVWDWLASKIMDYRDLWHSDAILNEPKSAARPQVVAVKDDIDRRYFQTSLRPTFRIGDEGRILSGFGERTRRVHTRTNSPKPDR
jgi:hypothetical protein